MKVIAVLFTLFLSSVLASDDITGSNAVSTNKFLGLDISHLNISCSACNSVEDKLFAIASNETHLNDTTNAILDATCRNGFLKALPHVEAKCSQYVSELYLSAMEALVYLKPKINICSRVLQCGKILNPKAVKVHGQTVLFVFLSKLSVKDAKLASNLEAIAIDRTAGLTTLVETICDAAQETKNLPEKLSARVDQLCNFGDRPQCSLCRAGNDLIEFYLPRVNKIFDKGLENLCKKDKTCLHILGDALGYVQSFLKNLLESDFLCYKLKQCNEPGVFTFCDKLPGLARKFCNGLVIAELPAKQNLLKEHKLFPVTPKDACDYCNSTATGLIKTITEQQDKIRGELEDLCGAVPLITSACKFFILEDFNTTIEKVHTLLEPDEVCPRFDLCHQPKNVSSVDHDFFCSRCNTVVVFLQSKVRDELIETNLKKKVSNICQRYVKSEKSCDYVVEKYFHRLFNFITGPLISNNVCSRIPHCIAPSPPPFQY